MIMRRRMWLRRCEHISAPQLFVNYIPPPLSLLAFSQAHGPRQGYPGLGQERHGLRLDQEPALKRFSSSCARARARRGVGVLVSALLPR